MQFSFNFIVMRLDEFYRLCANVYNSVGFDYYVFNAIIMGYCAEYCLCVLKKICLLVRLGGIRENQEFLVHRLL